MNKGSAGFTLIELLVVVALVAVATAAVTLSLRKSSDAQLDREAARLCALLDAARAESRTTGIAIHWMPANQGFLFWPWPATASPLPDRWMAADVQAHASPTVLTLGPAPIIEASRVTLIVGDRQLTIGTDGLHAFAPVEAQL
ncbi:MAG: prepilin-type N-terminal cleavage/methylation domain-containing protein [Pseudoxanthomonas sp.]